MKVGTSSEDQTTKIWDLTHLNPNLEQILKGHERAVTSIDWQV